MKAAQLRVVDQAASLLLDYPTPALVARLPVLAGALAELPAGTARSDLTGFVEHVGSRPLPELARHYVETFDLRRKSCLYLTYYADGDTRRRGVTLVRLKQYYRRAGVEFAAADLPDFLPVVLEFGAATGDRSLLGRHVLGLQLIRLGLVEAGSPYRAVLDALLSTLPGPTADDREAVLALARNGPPQEEVGLEPFPTGGAP
ncbi:nitrate reductase molybdenum cofactor assembly chaperone [Rhodococcus sp. SGAir0479]|uniref:nitrate reductase molybdenum cofactor assembly chaperone n=1 Tax=Rhodococcus sp. SGAir0479 TaxID=2567884 RepID=UPI0010CD0CBB|nr:nitrate reductase molybdenum cofactor assembly chaperone [Rhodococcus sp. SGAir0479]QCQ93376.1 nitrate reductase molybdenum cofactor assembly chaperone [Rhodococcus sp. SGAir0479]